MPGTLLVIERVGGTSGSPLQDGEVVAIRTAVGDRYFRAEGDSLRAAFSSPERAGEFVVRNLSAEGGPIEPGKPVAIRTGDGDRFFRAEFPRLVVRSPSPGTEETFVIEKAGAEKRGVLYSGDQIYIRTGPGDHFFLLQGDEVALDVIPSSAAIKGFDTACIGFVEFCRDYEIVSGTKQYKGWWYPCGACIGFKF